jgi:hypothetical protein
VRMGVLAAVDCRFHAPACAEPVGVGGDHATIQLVPPRAAARVSYSLAPA